MKHKRSLEMSSVGFCLSLEHSHLVETLKKLLPKGVHWYSGSLHPQLTQVSTKQRPWVWPFTNPVVLVLKTCQYWSKPLAWRVASATIEFAAVSIAGTTGRSGFAELAKETRPFV